ncbi:MAG: sporulation protein YabP [Christensenellaceae bacterium]|jgi:sporulation protein YabP|nr:sporulation protein YabP [Christensenellaceae bacterium]
MIEQKAIESGRIRAHSIHIDERQLMSISGVKDVDSFNEQEVQLLTEAGELRIEGAELHLTKLDLDAGQVILEGEIFALEYASEQQASSGSLLSRLFR